MFWILTDYSDRSFSFNDLAFFADRLYRWSYFHWKSSFRKFIKICSILSAQIQYTHAFGLYIITAKYKMQALFWIKSHFFIFSLIFPNHPSIKTGFNICSGACLKNHSRNLHAPLCGIFHPNSVAVAHYGALVRAKYPTNCDAHLAESLFQTRSRVPIRQESVYVRYCFCCTGELRKASEQVNQV